MKLFMRIMFAVMKTYVDLLIPTFLVVVTLLIKGIETLIVVIPPFITPILTSVAMES